MGWNLGIIGKSIHLIEPFTSTPINRTNDKNRKKIINKYFKNKKNISLSIAEKVIKINSPSIKKSRCLIKKQYEFVSSLSDAIKDVETNEKNRPNKNKPRIKDKINLSIFFHQS